MSARGWPVIGWIMASKRYICQEPQNINLFGVNIFADIIKVKILARDHCGFGWVLNPKTSPSKKREGETEADTWRERPCDDVGRDGPDAATNQGWPGRGKPGVPPRAFRGSAVLVTHWLWTSGF